MPVTPVYRLPRVDDWHPSSTTGDLVLSTDVIQYRPTRGANEGMAPWVHGSISGAYQQQQNVSACESPGPQHAKHSP